MKLPPLIKMPQPSPDPRFTEAFALEVFAVLAKYGYKFADPQQCAAVLSLARLTQVYESGRL